MDIEWYVVRLAVVFYFFFATSSTLSHFKSAIKNSVFAIEIGAFDKKMAAKIGYLSPFFAFSSVCS